MALRSRRTWLSTPWGGAPSCQWVVAAGGRPPYEEASEAGFAYYTRHYRARNGHRPEPDSPLRTDAATLRIFTTPADNGTWSVAIIAVAKDAPFKALRRNDAWERVARAVLRSPGWTDGEPLCDVLPMAGVLDRYCRIIVDGQPVITGLVPIGDAWACTNPSAARGFALGLAHAVTLRDALRSATGTNIAGRREDDAMAAHSVSEARVGDDPRSVWGCPSTGQPIADAVGKTGPQPVTATFDTASPLVLHRDHRIYEWTHATPLPIGPLRPAALATPRRVDSDRTSRHRPRALWYQQEWIGPGSPSGHRGEPGPFRARRQMTVRPF